jgi:hypothetical protein
MHSPIEQHPEILHWLGVITARWSVVESLLANTLGDILNDRRKAVTIYYSLGSFRQRQQLILSVATAHLQPSYQRRIIERCLEKLGKLWSARNGFMHSPFIAAGFDIESIRIKRMKLPITEIPLRLGDLQRHANAVSYQSNRLFVLGNRDGIRALRIGRASLRALVEQQNAPPWLPPDNLKS